jgi:hypothetical protein
VFDTEREGTAETIQYALVIIELQEMDVNYSLF